jgi:hypothetical protein
MTLYNQNPKGYSSPENALDTPNRTKTNIAPSPFSMGLQLLCWKPARNGTATIVKGQQNRARKAKINPPVL